MRCAKCYKPITSRSGFSRHQRFCLQRLPKPKPTFVNTFIRDIDIDLQPRLDVDDSTWQSDDDDWIRTTNLEELDHVHRMDDEDTEPGPSKPSAVPNSSSECPRGAPSSTSSRTSNMTTSRIETYESVTGKGSGDPTGGAPYDRSDCRHRGHDKYYPFVSEGDYAMAKWLLSAECTQGDITRFFQDPRLSLLHAQLSFKNTKELFGILHKIPYGIQSQDWHTIPFKISCNAAVDYGRTFYIRYREMQPVIEFLLGHRPFAPDLSYSPVRLYAEDDSRIYNEMHTGDWWWETQKKLPTGSTVVPILVGSDKTLLTQHIGDVSAWPVYISIGNLNRETRRKQTRPTIILLGFIPVTKDGNIKADVYHTALGIMMKPLEALATTGLDIQCADGYIRRCYPILAGFMVDYEEQVLITGIKQGIHCTICKVPRDERQNLMGGPWEKRSHDDTKRQIMRQRTSDVSRSDEEWVHDVPNFAWKHHHFNVHEGLMVDILHQLLKGIMMNLITWTRTVIAEVVPVKRRQVEGSDTALKLSASQQLDNRFQAVPAFPGLRTFKNFSKITQWTGVENQALVHQLIPVITPLLLQKRPGAIQCAASIIDFIIMAQWKTHNDISLGYMHTALERLDKLKEAFRDTRPVAKGKEDGHFNYPKFHAITHYTEFIKRYGCADGFDSAVFEAAHKFLLKAYYDRTNKTEGYEDQLILHVERRILMLAMDDELLYMDTVLDLPKSTPITAPLNTLTKAYPISSFGWVSHTRGTGLNLGRGYRSNVWRTANEVAAYCLIPDFLPALAVFVREMRKQHLGLATQYNSEDLREVDYSWVKSFPVKVHTALKCWRRDGKNYEDIEEMSPEFVRCHPSWGGRRIWRRDHVWVQEFDPRFVGPNGQERPWGGRMVGLLQTLITVGDLAVDIDYQTVPVVQGNRQIQYSGALIKLLKYRDPTGQPHKTHGMVELQDWPEPSVLNPRILGAYRFFEVQSIVRSAHIVLGERLGQYYINNYIDFDQYNDIYSASWVEDNNKAIRNIRNLFKGNTTS